MTWLTQITMGSLFDGIGGFPLAAVRNGITPVWASEIEAFPIEVTKLRFPGMIHVGDITKLHGAELPPVDIICGGSPCQDLSVAGARAGLAGARSAFPTSLSQAPILTDGPMSVISRQAICFLLRGAVWTRNCVASRSVASAFFSLLTLPGRSRPSFYLMYLTKRKTVRRRSHRCTDSIRPGN